MPGRHPSFLREPKRATCSCQDTGFSARASASAPFCCSALMSMLLPLRGADPARTHRAASFHPEQAGSVKALAIPLGTQYCVQVRVSPLGVVLPATRPHQHCPPVDWCHGRRRANSKSRWWPSLRRRHGRSHR